MSSTLPAAAVVLAIAAAHPSLPGPPPGAGTDLPAAPGTAPAQVGPGSAATVPATPAGPALLDGDVTFDRASRRFSLALACAGHGSLAVRLPGIVRRPIASGRFRCLAGRARPRLSVTSAVAARVARLRTVVATATASHTRLFFTLHTGAPSAAKFWTDGHLQCGAQSYLVEPDFTTATPTEISTRGWIAWSTPNGGWHWLGDAGVNASRWQPWTATRTGIEQFHPGGTPSPAPWTWGPISVPSGARAAGVFEVVYWVAGRPDYQWEYVNAGVTGAAAAGSGTLSCTPA